MALARDSCSHKGENGKVAIIGVSRHQHGAPLYSALAAEAAGVDLLYVFVPACHEEAAKRASLQVQVYTFGSAAKDELTDKDVTSILEFLATMSCAVIGPGLARTPSNLKQIKKILSESLCPLVCDASALQSFTVPAITGKSAVLTPHLGELERMGIAPDDLSSVARTSASTIILKGSTDRIAGKDGEITEVIGGNAGLTHGGTGDALAGLAAGLIAQNVPHAESARLASTVIKRAGTKLYETHGYSYTTQDVIRQIPGLLHALTA